MNNELLSFSKKLISIPSITGDATTAMEILDVAKEYLSGYTFTPYASNGVASLLYTNKPEETKNFKLIFNAHLDVVPAQEKDFTPIEKDGKLYGRGAYDTKAAAAAMIMLYKKYASQVDYPLGLQLTTDEEQGGDDGTRYQLSKGVRGDFVIASECSSNFSIIHEAKARLVIKLIAKGKHSHSAYPWLGDNAIWKLQNSLQALLKKYPWQVEEEYKTTLNVTHISTGNVEKRETAYNRTPNYCEAIVDVRFVPNDKKTILDDIQATIMDDVEMKILHNSTPHETPEDNKHVTLLKQIGEDILHKPLKLKKQHGTSDIRHFSGVGNYGVEFGPIGGNHHSDGEWLDIQSLGSYYEILKKFILEFND